MPLYTFILDYQGGTYISQTAAASPDHAINNWANSFDASSIPGFSPDMKVELIQASSEEKPTAIEGVENIWCISCSIKGRLLLIHFVQTEESIQ